MPLRRWFRPHLLIPLAAIAARLLAGPRTIDDAYITFRYAANLLAGNGLVYNPGELVLGTTTPFYALLLSLLGSLVGGPQADFPRIAWLLSAAVDGLNAWLLMRLGARLGMERSGIAAAAVWAIAPWSVSFAIGGMETSVFVALLLATLYLHLENQPVYSALTAGLSLLTRPEALLLLPLLFLQRLWDSRRRRPDTGARPITAGEAAALLIPVSLWGAYGAWIYGSPIPSNIAAKAAAYAMPPYSGLIRLLQHYATPFLGHDLLGGWWIAAGLLLFPGLCLLGGWSVLRRHPRSWPLLVFPWLYLLAYSLANPLIFRWYLTPPLPFYLLLIFAGLERLAADLKFPGLFNLAAAAAFALTASGWTLQPDHGPALPAPRMAYIELELLYAQAADIVGAEADPGDLLAAGDIGVLGYRSGLRIMDTVGLITPQAARYYPLPPEVYVINYAVSSELVLDQQPEWLVILEVYGRRTLLTNPDFQQRYILHSSLPTGIYGSQGMLIFQRLD